MEFKIKEGRFMVAGTSADNKIVEASGPQGASGSNQSAGTSGPQGASGSNQTASTSGPQDASGDKPCHKQASGDAACAFSLPAGRLAFILSDGMGKGMKAAAESKAVVTELKRLLKKDVAPARAIKLVNKKLITSKEMFATVDLTVIDKQKKTASFYKMGAASSFLLRNGQVKKIEQAALPIGIVKRVKASQTKIKLRSKDLLIIVSDGITEADRRDIETRWLQEYLTQNADIEPTEMAGEIAKIAQSKYKTRERDDITVIVIRIE